jgi:hypothetical protein
MQRPLVSGGGGGGGTSGRSSFFCLPRSSYSRLLYSFFLCKANTTLLKTRVPYVKTRYELDQYSVVCVVKKEMDRPVLAIETHVKTIERNG